MSNATKRWGRAGIASLATTALVASGLTAFAGAASASEPVDFERIAGDNRYETSVEAAEAFGSTDHALLASGEQGHYVDALSANFLAGVQAAPILLTREDQLPAAVKAHLESSAIDSVTIIGGELAVSAAVQAELEEMGITVNRVAGQNRFFTNQEVIEAGAAEADETALIATGLNFPDALGAGPVSFAGKHPVGLTKTNDIPDYVVDALKAAGVTNALVLGGPLAVGDEVIEELEDKGITVERRLEGGNREATSIEVAEYAIANLGFSESEVDFASGRPFSEGIDALSGGPVSGKELTPILITVDENRAPRLIDYLEENCQRIDEGDIYGGPLALSTALEGQLEAAAECATNQDFTVNPASAATLNIGETRSFTVTGLEGVSAVDIALVPCDEVTRDGDTITFGDDEGDTDEADNINTANATADIDRVNGVVQADSTDYVNNASVVNGQVTFRITGEAAGCVVAVVFQDADGQDDLDLDANNQPTEQFAVTGNTTFVAVADVNATPENEVNRFGAQHTVQAQLVDNAGGAVAVAGRTVRFQVLRNATCDPANDTVTGGTVIQTGQATTGADGSASFTYTGPADPSAANDADVNDCIQVWYDADNDGVLDNGEFTDVVSKTWSDDQAAATTLQVTPETDTNPVGSNHTVTAAVTNQFGEPVANQAVTFEVWREGPTLITTQTVVTGANGQAALTYAGPATEADDVILACVDNDATPDGCDATATFDPEGATLDAGELDDFAVKRWVANQTAAVATAQNSCVLAADTAANTVDVEDGDVNRRFAYDAGDRFNIVNQAGVAQAVGIEAFEAAVTAGDRIHVDFAPNGISTFTLVNDDDCAAEPGEPSTVGGVVPQPQQA